MENGRKGRMNMSETNGTDSIKLTALSSKGGCGCKIGPTDLAGSMGHHGDGAHPEVRAAVASAIARCKRAGKPVGTLAATLEAAVALERQGVDFVVLASDLGLLLAQVRRVQAGWRAAFGHEQGGQAPAARY